MLLKSFGNVITFIDAGIIERYSSRFHVYCQIRFVASLKIIDKTLLPVTKNGVYTKILKVAMWNEVAIIY